MTNNSPVYWEANGLSLHTMAWSVKSFGGRRFFGSSKRGEDIEIPFRHGRTYVPKMRQPQVYDMQMFVLPLTADGNKDPDKTRIQKAHENWRLIVDRLDVDGQFPLIKRWWDETPAIRSATAMAELVEGSGPDVDDGTGFYCSLTVLLADPFFYGSAISEPVGTIDVVGDVPTDRLVITMSAGRVTNTRDGNWIEFDGSGTVEIDCATGLAKQGGIYLNGQVERNPAFAEWIKLYPGENVLTGAGTIEYEPAYR